jgi:hypothetical protein
MSYENEVRPTRTDRYIERSYGDSSYVLPVLALLIILGLGAWFAMSYSNDSTPSTSTTTIERTTPAPSVPAPTPTTPSTPSPAPTTPK